MRPLIQHALRLFVALVVLLALVPIFGASAALRPAAAVDNSAAIGRAVSYLKNQQRADGGFEGFTPGASDDFTTLRVVLALASAGYPQPQLTHSTAKATALGYLTSRAKAYIRDDQRRVFPGRAGQLAVAVIAAGGDPTSFGDIDLLSDIQSTYNASTGVYSSAAVSGFSTGAAGTINQLWPIMALAAAGQITPTRATDYLLSLQESDGQGGWGFGVGSDLDTTAQVLQALTATRTVPPNNSRVQQALRFLSIKQLSTGGWPDFSGSLNADTTAGVIQAFAALGTRPESLTKGSRTPYTDLLSLQAVDGGFGNALATADSIPGLATMPFPVARYKLRFPAIAQNQGL